MAERGAAEPPGRLARPITQVTFAPLEKRGQTGLQGGMNAEIIVGAGFLAPEIEDFPGGIDKAGFAFAGIGAQAGHFRDARAHHGREQGKPAQDGAARVLEQGLGELMQFLSVSRGRLATMTHRTPVTRDFDLAKGIMLDELPARGPTQGAAQAVKIELGRACATEPFFGMLPAPIRVIIQKFDGQISHEFFAPKPGKIDAARLFLGQV